MRAYTLILLLILSGCSRPDDQQTGSIDQETMEKAGGQLSEAGKAKLDSANAAFKSDDFTTASRLYRESARIDDAAAAWFGVYMAETALKHPEAADSALRRAQQKQPGASLLREDHKKEERK